MFWYIYIEPNITKEEYGFGCSIKNTTRLVNFP